MNKIPQISNIDWNPPQPRQGVAGMFDEFIGPGAAPAEIWLQFTPNILAAIGIVVYAYVK